MTDSARTALRPAAVAARSIQIAGTAALTVILAATLTGCEKEVVESEPLLRPVRTKVVQPFAESVPSVIAGVAKSGLESNLSFRVSGTLVDLPAVVGRSVRRGQVLARVDPTDYDLTVQEAEASLAQAQASLRQAIADYGRVRALYENNNAAKSDLDAARAAFESAQAQVRAADKRLEQAEQQVDYTQLRAPVDGAVAAVDVEVNETVSAGQTVVRITSGATPEIEVAVSEVTIPYLRVAMSVTVRFDALPGQSFPGTVTEVGLATTAGRSTYPVTVRLGQSSPMIRSGMAAEVTFAIDDPDRGDRLLIPPVAIGEDRSGRFVFVVEDNGGGTGRVRRRAVEVGRFTPQGVEIVTGLSFGETVVTAGVRRLIDDMQVRLLEGATP